MKSISHELLQRMTLAVSNIWLPHCSWSGVGVFSISQWIRDIRATTCWKLVSFLFG